ncbi:hypothetical protein BDB00DRAFT_638002 [Zychaea mexicana]|uniref:uncharacterized protein n=1 Tax=Zychaea mexicana TaxID=64656 RepID=UPI0022FE7B91|nr:uncharacterized protein BDB00DRAFT_638002 [Zychaea mexicana]KAI9489190.1 hypothetical protein BDB00DRAFT_638002 [Zychaea mexicana]
MTIVEYLVIKAQADTTHQDKDGWRALHNACSRGHLPMVQFLVECGAPVNARSRIGNTPLINAASKGNTAVVEYLLNEAEADPLLHNEFGETAYDAAAAIGSVYLCELLEAAERACWVDPIRGRDGPYDPLSIHVTVPVLIHENQRAVTSLLRGLGKQLPTFSSSALSKNDRRSAWSLYPSGKPTTRGHVKLPPLDRNASWFWLTDWTVDYSHPKSDNEGWQYGKSFEYTDDEEWTAAIPTSGAGWVRRRRWMRIMKRRVDHQQQQLESAAASGGQVIIAGAREQEVQTGESNSLMGGTTTTTDQGGHDHLRLVERQEQASGSSHTSNNNSGSSSNSTVGMSLTKAQSVFVGCTTHVQSVETAAAAAAGAGATEPEPSPRQSSLELTRASVRSSIASSHSCHVQPHYYHHHHHHRPTYVWERNEQAAECRRCGRWFNLLVRRHHCRFGYIF